MKYTLLALILLTGCAAQADDLKPLDLSSLPLSKFTHADIKNAADYATSNGYPARAAVWNAIDAQLTACEGAINTLMPKLPSSGSTVGLATGFEIAAEGVGTGIPTAVKLNCSAVQLPGGLGLLK